MHKTLAWLIVSTLFTQIMFGNMQEARASLGGVAQLPQPTQTIGTSGKHAGALVRGLRLVSDDIEHPRLELMIDTGDDRGVSRSDAERMTKYLLAALAVENKDIWVNLSVYEKDRVTDATLMQTDLGSDLLAQDYVLKQLASSLTHPDSVTGKAYWSALGSENPQSLGKIWIVPSKAEVTEYDSAAYVTQSELDLRCEDDMSAVQKTLLPVIRKEINEGARFAELRAIYHAVILAHWLKAQTNARPLAGTRNVSGLPGSDPMLIKNVFNRYERSFEQGTYRTVRSQDGVARQYFSGGAAFADLGNIEEVKKADSPLGIIAAFKGVGIKANVMLKRVRSNLANRVYRVVSVGLLLSQFFGAVHADSLVHFLLDGKISEAKAIVAKDTEKQAVVADFEAFLKDADALNKDANKTYEQMYQGLAEKTNYIHERTRLGMKTEIDKALQAQYWTRMQAHMTVFRKGILAVATAKKDTVTYNAVIALDSLERQDLAYQRQLKDLEEGTSADPAKKDTATVDYYRTLKAQDSVSALIKSFSAKKVDTLISLGTLSGEPTRLKTKGDSLTAEKNVCLAGMEKYALDTTDVEYIAWQIKKEKVEEKIAANDAQIAKVNALATANKADLKTLADLQKTLDSLARIISPEKFPAASAVDPKTALLKKIDGVRTKIREQYFWLFNGGEASVDLAKRYAAEMDRLAADVSSLLKEFNITDAYKNVIGEQDKVVQALSAQQVKRAKLSEKAKKLAAVAQRAGIEITARELMALVAARPVVVSTSGSAKDGYASVKFTALNVLFWQLGGVPISVDASGQIMTPDKAYDRNATYRVGLRAPIGNNLFVLASGGLLHTFRTNEYMKPWLSPGTALTQKLDTRGKYFLTQAAAVGNWNIFDIGYFLNAQTMLNRTYLTSGKSFDGIRWNNDDVFSQEGYLKARLLPTFSFEAKFMQARGNADATVRDTMFVGHDSTVSTQGQLTRIPMTLALQDDGKSPSIKGSFTFTPEQMSTEVNGAVVGPWIYKMNPKVTLLFGTYASFGFEYEFHDLGQKMTLPWTFLFGPVDRRPVELTVKETVEWKRLNEQTAFAFSRSFEDVSLRVNLRSEAIPYFAGTATRETYAGINKNADGTPAATYGDWYKQNYALEMPVPGVKNSKISGGLELKNTGTKDAQGKTIIAPGMKINFSYSFGGSTHTVNQSAKQKEERVPQTPVVQASVAPALVVAPAPKPVVVPAKQKSETYVIDVNGELIADTSMTAAIADAMVEKGNYAAIPQTDSSGTRTVLVSLVEAAKDFSLFAKKYGLAFAFHDGAYVLSVAAVQGSIGSFIDPLSNECKKTVRFPSWVFAEQKAAFDGTLPLPWTGVAPVVAVLIAVDRTHQTLLTYLDKNGLRDRAKSGCQFLPTLRTNEYLMVAPDGTRAVIWVRPEAVKYLSWGSSGIESKDLGGVDFRLDGVASMKIVSSVDRSVWGSAARGLAIESVRLYAMHTPILG